MIRQTQVLFIHGGMTFKSHKDYLHYLKTKQVDIAKLPMWFNEYLTKKLGKAFHIIRPRMPLSDNAKYQEWKIMFERYIPQLKNNMILIGVSLGAIFLAKYLSEHKVPKKILSVYLICPPFDNTVSGEDLVGGFKLKANLSLLEKNCKNIKLLFSKTDDVVPIAHAVKYAKKLKHAKIIIYPDMNGHFKISEFPEIVKMIRLDVKGKII
jgi:hypothetical protein